MDDMNFRLGPQVRENAVPKGTCPAILPGKKGVPDWEPMVMKWAGGFPSYPLDLQGFF
jgi:hypothetical protein